MKLSLSAPYFVVFWGSLALVPMSGCGKSSGEKDASAVNAAGGASPYQEAADKYKALSNFVCRVPFFTTNYDDAVESAQGTSPSDMGNLVATMQTTFRDFIVSDFAVASLSEFEGASAITHSAAVTKAINFTKGPLGKVDSAAVLKAIQALPESGKRFLTVVKMAMALNSDEDAYRMLLFKLKMANHVQRAFSVAGSIGGLKVVLPAWLKPIVSNSASAVGQGMNVLGFVGMFCTAMNVAAAGFEALAAAESESETKLQAETIGNDACARLNSNPGHLGKLCPDQGSHNVFAQGRSSQCGSYRVSPFLNTGAPVFGVADGRFQKFRVGANKNLVLDTSASPFTSTTAKGNLLVKMKVMDSSAANGAGGTGWFYTGSVQCLP